MDEFGEGEEDPLGGSVSITADTKPWEKALDRASEKMQEWGGKVTSILDKASEYNELKISEWGKNLTKLSEQNGEQIGAKLGDKVGSYLGAAIGTVLGPGVGTYIGKELGSEIGEQLGKELSKLDTKEIFESLAGVLSPVGEAIDTIKYGWEGIVFDADYTIGHIKTLFSDFNPEELLGSDSGKAWDKLKASAEAAWTSIEEMATRSAFRISNMMQNVFEVMQEPLARLSDVVQGLLVKWGVLEESANKWGDAIRGIGDVAKTVFGAMVQAIGHIEGVIRNVGGTIQYTFGVLFMTAISKVMNQIGESLLKLEPVVKKHLTKDQFEALEDIEVWFRSQAANIDDAARGLRNTAAKNQNVKGSELAEKYKQEFDNLWSKSKDQSEMQDWFRDLMKTMTDDLNAIINMEFNKAMDQGDNGIEKANSASTRALLERSQEAANIINVQGTGGSYPDKVLGNWEKAFEKSKRQIELLEGIKKALEQENKLIDMV